MRAVRPFSPDKPPILEVVALPEPDPGPGEVLVRVLAAGLNRADLLQMKGGYPPPPGVTSIPGLECTGIVEKLGEGVVGIEPGARVMALLAGGGQAEKVAVPAGQLIRWPESLTVAEAGGLMEAAITAWTNLVVEGGLAAGETVLVTGATSGVGSFAVQLARELGARVIAAGRSPERLAELAALGVPDHVVLDDGFVASVQALTAGRGADLVLDLVGGEWTARALEALAPRGRLVLVGLTAGARATVDLATVLRRRLRLVGSVLRSRPSDEKSSLVCAFREYAAERLERRALLPMVARELPFERAAEAYAALAAGGLTGKVVLTMP
jgi:putative PIG3 family NAD(P)H quinone oxidoreductase